MLPAYVADITRYPHYKGTQSVEGTVGIVMQSNFKLTISMDMSGLESSGTRVGNNVNSADIMISNHKSCTKYFRQWKWHKKGTADPDLYYEADTSGRWTHIPILNMNPI